MNTNNCNPILVNNTGDPLNLNIHTKIRIFNSNVLSVLLYGLECWKTSVAAERKLEFIPFKCLWRIFNIHWPNVISNEELLKRTGMSIISETIKSRWHWLGHVLRIPHNSLPRVALRGTPQGKRNRDLQTNCPQRPNRSEVIK